MRGEERDLSARAARRFLIVNRDNKFFGHNTKIWFAFVYWIITGLKAAVLLPVAISLFFSVANYFHSAYLYLMFLLIILFRYQYRIKLQKSLKAFLDGLAETEYQTREEQSLSSKFLFRKLRGLLTKSHRKLLKVWCNGYWRDHLFSRDAIHVETFILLTVGAIFFIRPEMVLFSDEYWNFIVGASLLLFDVVFQGILSGFGVSFPKPFAYQNMAEYLLLSYLTLSMVYNFGSELSKRYAIWSSAEYWFVGNYNGLNEFMNTCLDFHVKWFGALVIYDFGPDKEFGRRILQQVDLGEIKSRAEMEECEINKYVTKKGMADG